MNPDTLQIILSVLFIISGLFHFIMGRSLERYAVKRGLLNANIAVKMSGVLLLGAGAALFFPKYQMHALYALAGFHLLAAIILHRFWEEKQVDELMLEGIHFMKNLIVIVLLLFLVYYI